MNRNKTAKAGASFKLLALIASLSMILAGFAAGLMASPASAAAPSVCPSGYVLNVGTGLCEGTATAVAVPGETPVDYTCPEGWVGPNASNKCTRHVDATFEYQCPTGYLPIGAVVQGATCTKTGTWNWESEHSEPSEGEWECSVDEEINPNSGVEDIRPTNDCSKTRSPQKVWFCATAVVDPPKSGHNDRSKREEQKFHEEKHECGDRDQADPPTCADEVIPADPWYDYFCPAGYFPPSAPSAAPAVVQGPTPVEKGTICEKPVTIAPTCPVGQNLVNGDCVTPSNPPADVPAASVPVVESTPVVVAAATVEAPAEVAVPAAATVAAPAPATVAVPAAATVPAAVPAGDGSQAPGLPMWALAMIAVGVLGAGFAGKSILAARK